MASAARQKSIAVIGAGIVGLATARALARERRAEVIVLEAEGHVAAHQTGNNSGVIHSGLYYRPGSLKARLCAQGREAMYRFCADHGIAHERCGKVVVALEPGQLGALDELERRGRANGLASLRRLSIEQIREHEPNVAGIAGLYVGETGIVDYRQVAQAYARTILEHDGQVRLSWRVRAVSRSSAGVILHTTGGDVEADGVVNCAGLQCDRVARMCGDRPRVRIIPFRGEYYSLSRAAWGLVRNLIYPVPDPAFPFLGVHFTRMIGGGVEAGPNAVLALARHGYSWRDIDLADLRETLAFRGFWRMAARYWRTGLGEVRRSLSLRAFLAALQRLVPAIESQHLVPGGAGVRAQAVDRDGRMVDDFCIQTSDRMVHVLNAPSPAATASLAIGGHIAQLAEQVLGLESGRRV
jgi:L-2-hydroxyglutarate oxidase